MGALTSSRAERLQGRIFAPGDKSISHRALIFGAMAAGETSVHGLLEGDDVLRTAGAMRAFGAKLTRDLSQAGPLWRVTGGKWTRPDRPIYFGNSGTGCRLVMGAAAGQGVECVFDGDVSLRGRPMKRITDPLALMGAAFETRDGKLPVSLRGGARLTAITYEMPVASAQVKSAVLLAGLGAHGTTTIVEPVVSRDHTERMLKAFGVSLVVEEAETGGRVVSLAGGQRLEAASIQVPGDPSSAAFPIAAAAIIPGSDVVVENVLINPLRTGFFATLIDMGADLTFENEREENGETVADIHIRHANLKGIAVPSSRAPSMIDEYPILAVVASFASGDTYMPGIEELRVKESDRIDATEAMLRANGVSTDAGPDWLRVEGTGKANGDVAGGALVKTSGDHRIAMSALVLGLATKAPVSIDDASMIATSFPGFEAVMASLGARFSAS